MINTSKPINPPPKELCDFIIDKLGISESALQLGIKRSSLENEHGLALVRRFSFETQYGSPRMQLQTLSTFAKLFQAASIFFIRLFIYVKRPFFGCLFIEG